MVVKNKKWLFGIRNRILIFTFIVTLIPLLGIGWVFYSQTQQLLWEKMELEVLTSITHARQEIEIWIKKSSLNISVFSNSFLITENLETFLNSKDSNNKTSSAETAASIKKITDYLSLVQAEFDEYKRLILLDSNGVIITQSTRLENSFTLPGNWREQLDENNIVISETMCNEESNESCLTIIVPILSDKNRMIGLLASELTIKAVKSIFNAISIPDYSNLLLINKDGYSRFSTSRETQNLSPHVNSKDLAMLLDKPINFTIYTNAENVKVIGITASIQKFPWNILIDKNYDLTFAEVNVLKKIIFIIAIMLVSIFGGIAYLVSQSILNPLKQLIAGANKVAAGDLDFELPASKNDELGFAISIFNAMVTHLRRSHEEKEKLLRIDSLTKLFHRKHMMEILTLQIERYRRNQKPFSVFMADLDFFKKINDNYGHPAGDAVLRKVGTILNKALRSVDTAGRYGGEEFIIILDEIGEHGAIQTAERIRNAIQESEVRIEGAIIKFTISIGTVTISNNADTEESLINMADKALYQAKNSGRNRVCSSGSDNRTSPGTS